MMCLTMRPIQQNSRAEPAVWQPHQKGIEIGYYAPRKDDILAFLADKDYDLKLLSVHHNGSFDYLEEPVLQLDKMELIPSYLRELEEAIEAVPADVLAHFDYGSGNSSLP